MTNLRALDDTEREAAQMNLWRLLWMDEDDLICEYEDRLLRLCGGTDEHPLPVLLTEAVFASRWPTTDPNTVSLVGTGLSVNPFSTPMEVYREILAAKSAMA